MRPETSTSVGEERLPDRIPSAGPGLPRVLLVDDDAGVRASLAFAFDLEGFDVTDYATAEAVAAEAAIAHDDCLVIDYRLPGMNGLELLALLRERGSRAPAIIITSNPTRKLRRAITDAGATLIEKPLLCDALLAGLRMMVRSYQPTPVKE